MTSQISIVGGGIAGLVLGQCLRKRQIPAIIWEKSKQIPALQNFGLTLQSGVYQSLLQHLELDEAILRYSVRSKESTPGDPVRVNRSAFLRGLAKDLDIRWGHSLTDLARGADSRHKLTFETADGSHTTHESDLVFVTDGVHSPARNSLHLDKDVFQLEVLPFVVYNGKRRFAADQLPNGLAACLTPNGISHGVGKTLLQITAGYVNSDKNEVGINYTLSRPAAGKSDDELLGRSNTDAESLARRFLEEASKLTELQEPFKSVFDPAVMKDDRLLHWLMRSALIDSNTAGELARTGIVLFGDSASPQPILGGAGANAAILDAVAISKAVEGSNVDTATYNDIQKQWTTWKSDAERKLSDMHRQAASHI